MGLTAVTTEHLSHAEKLRKRRMQLAETTIRRT